MPFTNIDNIRKHLVDTDVTRATFNDIPLQLSGTNPAALLHQNLVGDSVVVKGKELAAPHFVKQALGDEPAFLGKSQLIPDSVAVASDTSLGTIFTENVDYQINHGSGEISRLAAGKISAGATVAIWFYAYSIYQPSSDYFVNAAAGTIRRASDSKIEDGQVVFVDYKTTTSNFSDAQIEAAIVEANDRLKQLIAAEHHHSVDQSLISAETCIALAILLRIRAAATLQENLTAQPGSTARELLELAGDYDRKAIDIAAPYAAQRSTLLGPVGVTARSKE